MRRALAAALALWVLPAGAQCVFDGSGTIDNPDDPSCRDARFEYTENDAGAGQIALGYPPPVPVDSLTGVDGFRRYASLHARHQALFLDHLTVQGVVVGQTVSGADIWAYRLSDADDVTVQGFPEPAVMINGGIHAREWQSPEAVTELFERLAETAGDGALGSYLADNLAITVIPVLNVDGFEQTQRFPTRVAASDRQPRDGRMRRKNLANPAGGAPVDDDLDTSADQFDGVDLNRNTQHGFGLNNGSSANPISLVFRGPAADSEPETAALLAAAVMAPAERLRFYADMHSFSRLFFIPQTGNARRDLLTRVLADRVRAVSDDRYITVVDPVGAQIGTTADYFATEYEIPSWTFEIEPRNGGQDYGGTGASHSGFVLPDTEVARMRDEVAAMLILAAYLQAGPPSVTAAQITRRSDGAVVYRADWRPDAAAGTRSLEVSADAGLVGGVGYRLWVAFDKPMRMDGGAQGAAFYPGLSPAPLGAVSLQSGPAATDEDVVLAGDLSHWLGQPGGAPDGYARYRYDAFSLDLDLPVLAAPTGLVLSLDLRDAARQRLDADPSTPARWEDGRWHGYEDSLGEDLDSGGSDCTLLTHAAPPGTAGTTPAALTCKAAFVAPVPPPAPPPPPVTSSGGGGGAPWPPVLLGLMALRWRRR